MDATAPATCGVAIDVPFKVCVAVVDVYQADSTETPGATISTQVPKFENVAKASVVELAATVIALGVRAGE
jgi:hypothetical protein